MANTPNTIPTKRLAATIDGSAALIKLNNILDWSGADLTPSYLGDVLYAVLRDQDNTVLEIMQLDPTTIANNSTTGITITRRGLKFNGDLTTEVPANKLVWVKNQTIVEIGTDVPQIFQNFVNITDDQTLGGIKTFTSFPVKSGSTTPTAAGELATKAYVDATATGSATYDQNIVAGTAGETLVSGDLVYFKMSDQRWWKTDSDAAATSIDVKLGVSQGSASAGASVNILIGGLAKNFTGLTAGTAYFVSGTAGAVSSTRGTFARFVGRAVSTTSMFFDANSDIETMKQSMNQIYGASTTGNDTYVVTLVPTPAAYTNGMVVNFKADTANTGAATLNVNGLGAKTIKKNFDQTLSDNDIKVNQIVTVVYESVTDSFQMQSQVANTPSEYIADFGDGSDGNVTISSNTTLTRDMNYNNLTVDSTFNLITAGYRVYVKGTLTNNGTVHNNGSNASASTGGAGGLAGNFLGGASGPNGGGGGGGGGGIVFIAAYNVAVQGNIEAKGGAGGTPVSAANGNNAGTAGTAISRSLIQSGSSGAGGAAGGGPAGGASATITTNAKCSRGSIYILTMMIDGILQLAGGASGGSGGSYVSTGNAGGGGGGMGGVVVFLYRTMTTSGTISVAGGAAGNFWVSGSNGSAGSSGLSISLSI